MKGIFKNKKGFTLVELVIVMGITMLMAFLFVSLARDATDASLRFSRSLFTEQQIQQTLQIILPEIRSASQSNTGAYPISSAATSSFEFYSDIDLDGLFERVRYFLDGSTFKKGVIRPSGPPYQYVTSTESFQDLVDNMIAVNPIFTYYDISATSSLSVPLPLPIDVLRIKTVKVNLVANQGTTSTPAIVGVENEATIRNLRYK